MTPPRRRACDPKQSASVWLVDGFNVLHAGVLKGRDRREWWTAPVRERLLALAAGFDDPTAELWIAFDGPAPVAPARKAGASRPRSEAQPSEGGPPQGKAAQRPRSQAQPSEGGPLQDVRVRAVFAASADDWLVTRVRRAEDPARFAVVTCDRQVADRVRHRGARVVSPREFLARCTRS